MNREVYQEIRKNFSFKKKHSALLQVTVVNALFLLGCLLSWHFFRESYLRFVAIPLLALLIFRNFALMHEAAHNVASGKKWINDLVGIVSGSFCFLPYEPWKRSHLEHHSWSGNVDKDPVMAILNLYPSFPNWLKAALNFSWRWWIPTLGVAQNIVFWYLSVMHVIKKRDSFLMVVSTMAPPLFWAMIFAFAPLSFTFQIVIPGLYAYMVFFEVVGFPHHLTLPQQRGDVRLPVWEQYSGTRTCVYPAWFSRLAVLNFNYHVEHHMFPDAPWYYLEDLHKSVSLKLQSRYNSDNNFSWTLQNKAKNLEHILLANIPEKQAAKKTA